MHRIFPKNVYFDWFPLRKNWRSFSFFVFFGGYSKSYYTNYPCLRSSSESKQISCFSFFLSFFLSFFQCFQFCQNFLSVSFDSYLFHINCKYPNFMFFLYHFFLQSDFILQMQDHLSCNFQVIFKVCHQLYGVSLLQYV